MLIAFGDTFSGDNMTGTWRLNTLFRSSDTNLSNGMTVPPGEFGNGNMFGGAPLWDNPLPDTTNYARQIILKEKLPAGLPKGVTLIPTAGISLPDCRHRVRGNAIPQLHVGQAVGLAGTMEDELLGDRLLG